MGMAGGASDSAGARTDKPALSRSRAAPPYSHTGLLIAAPWLLKRWPVSVRRSVVIVVFFLLHTLGGRYTYSNLPYEAVVERDDRR